MLGKFVTAKLRDKDDCRQGAVICEDPLTIRDQTGGEYLCEGIPTCVVNPPNNCGICELPLANEGGLCVKCVEELSPDLKKLHEVFCAVDREIPGTRWELSIA